MKEGSVGFIRKGQLHASGTLISHLGRTSRERSIDLERERMRTFQYFNLGATNIWQIN